MDDVVDKSIPARLWAGNLGEGDTEVEDQPVTVQIDGEDRNSIALHTFINERGSLVSYYFDREAALSLAADVLKAVRLDG